MIVTRIEKLNAPCKKLKIICSLFYGLGGLEPCPRRVALVIFGESTYQSHGGGGSQLPANQRCRYLRGLNWAGHSFPEDEFVHSQQGE
jgi:hypothetical protein